MFETWSGSEIPLPKELAPNGERLWSYVHLQLQALWFYVEVEHLDADDRFASTYLLSTIAQLNSLSRDSSINILAVHVVTPKHLNHSVSWQMQRLKKILRKTQISDEDLSAVIIYILEDEKIITDPPGTPYQDLVDVELLFEVRS